MKLLAPFALLIACTAFGQNTIPNPGFENWTNSGSYEDPDGWFTSNQETSIAGVVTIEKTTDAHSGSYAIRLETKNVISQTIPGTAIAGVIDPLSLEIIPGFDICSNPTSLSGWFKYFPVFLAADVGSIEILLSKWNSTLHIREPVGTGIFTSPIGTTSSYTSFSTNIIYTSTNTADTAIITLLSGSYTQPPGSVLFIDDLSFVFPPITPPVSNFSSTDNGGGSFNFTDQTLNNPSSWSWTFGDGNTSTIQNPSNAYTSVNNSYNVCLTTTNCGGSDTNCDSVFVSDTTTIPGINTIQNDPYLVYPNPVTSELFIYSSRMNLATLTIQDLQGRLVTSTQLLGPTIQIDIQLLANGAYIYKLQDQTGGHIQSGMLVVDK